jgi:F-type H+-transporting ATPase subunit gamma
MAGLKEVRTRIASVISTKQITSAMKMVSASKLRKAQNAIVQLRPYAIKLNSILSNLSDSVGNTEESIYFKERKVNKVLIIVIASNRGLCGAFNSNVIKAAINNININYSSYLKSGNLDIICIGRKVSEYFAKRKFNIIDSYNDIYDHLTYAETTKISEIIMGYFVKGNYDKIEIVYNQFKNAAVQNLTIEQFLPILPTSKKSKTELNADYIFEPDKQNIIATLVPKTLKIQFYKCLIDSYASEHGARMTSMHKATDNAEEIRKQLVLAYNKARQASITNEILEIISGANALKG